MDDRSSRSPQAQLTDVPREVPAAPAQNTTVPFGLAVVDIRLPDPATGRALIRRTSARVSVVGLGQQRAHHRAALAAGAT